MNGRELLEAKLRNKGATTAQVNSKVVDWMLEIMAENSNDENMRAAAQLLTQQRAIALQAMNRGESLQREYQQKLWNFQSMTSDERRKMEKATSDAIEERDRAQEEFQKYVKLKEELMKMETPEARDVMRRAHWFRENTTIDTKYDNTAFIKGLGMILAGTTMKEEEE